MPPSPPRPLPATRDPLPSWSRVAAGASDTDVAPAAAGVLHRSVRLLRRNAAFLVVLAAVVGVVLWSGLRVSFVMTGSMAPGIRPRDGLVTISPALHQPQIGDVVIAQPRGAGIELPSISHRIVARDLDGWRTKGDANPAIDPWVVHDDEISGVILARIPGGLTEVPWVAAVLVAAAVGVVLWPTRRPTDADPPPTQHH